MTEAQAKAKGYEVKVGQFPFIGNGKAIALGEPEGMIKTVFDAKTGELLGAHMVGAEVTELIQGYTIAKTLETTEDELIAHGLPAPDAERDDARGGARRLRPRAPYLEPWTVVRSRPSLEPGRCAIREGAPAGQSVPRKPDWIRVKAPDPPEYHETRRADAPLRT